MNEDAGSRPMENANEHDQKVAGSQDDSEHMRKKNFVICVTYLLSAVDISCLFMQLSTIPYLAKDLGLNSVGFGGLQTVFGVLQLTGGPIFGRFSDQFGVRAALTLSFVSASLSYLLLGIATNIPLLFLSRIPAVFMHGLPGAQMVITNWTTPIERAGALGKLGLCFGLGMIIGSSLGGFLATKFGMHSPIFAGLIGSLLSTLAVQMYIPPHNKTKPEGHDAKQNTSKSSSVFDLKEITRLLRLPGVMPIFTIKVFSGLPTGLFMIMFAVISINFFGLDPAQSGYVMSYFGVLQMVVQGLVLGRLTSRYTDGTLLLLSLVVSIGVGLAMALMTNVLHFCIIAPPLIFSLSILAVITDSILTKAVPSSDTGAMLGICASVHPLTRTVGPTIGGLLYQRYGVTAFGCLHSVVNIVLVFYLLKKNLHRKEQKRE